jgi:hypothetical protein
MIKKSYLYLILFTIIIISFPSICFSELKTVENEFCQIYLGDINDKKGLDEFRKSVKQMSLYGGLYKIVTTKYGVIRNRCLDDIITKYLDKLKIANHTEKGRNICYKMRMTFNKELIETYLSSKNCFDDGLSWEDDIDDLFTDVKNNKINIGFIVENKIPELEGQKKEQSENQEERWFFHMIERSRNKYRLVDRKHIKTILEEQKFSMSGLTDTETVNVGKILNLDVIVLRMIYENNQVTKVLKVDTGEVLLFKTYKNTDVSSPSRFE